MLEHEDRIEAINKFWFGRVEETVVPSENRARIWFGEDPEIDQLIREQFLSDIEAIGQGKYDSWQHDSRGQLASIILLDQFPRHVFRDQPKAYQYDTNALQICLNGIDIESDHKLSLIERVFYYFPLLHAETVDMQQRSLESYRMLTELAFSETRVIYDSFLKFANHHYSIIQRFGRFPQRNDALGRGSTPTELAYLDEIQD